MLSLRVLVITADPDVSDALTFAGHETAFCVRKGLTMTNRSHKLSAVAVVSIGLAIVLCAAPAKAWNAYVTHGFGRLNNTVTVIDTASNTVKATISVKGEVGGVAVAPDGSKLYVTDRLTDSRLDTVSVIDAENNDEEEMVIELIHDFNEVASSQGC